METVHSVRIDHGPVQTTNMSYPQRQQPNHRPSHAQQTELYKPSRSPISAATTTARYPYPASPQLQPPPPNQRYSVQPPFTTYRDIRQPRISLLHPEYGQRSRELQFQQQQQHHHLEQGQQPFKKIRLQDSKDIQPLRIDTREPPGSYNPQVEAISPTLPDHIQQEDQAFRTTKDDLLQQIGKVDREIAKAESQISILKKKQAELEEVASKPTVKSEIEEDVKHQSLAQKIYAENRKRASNAHAKLDSLGGKVDWPIYNQPSDSAVYQENKRKNVSTKKRLLEYFKKRHAEKDNRNTYLTETYSKLMQEWVRKVDKVEGSAKRKAKEAKNREFFEKVFPELRKQREDKERFNRVGSRIKSEADLEEIMDNLQEQAMEDKKMRSYAVIPPILFDAKEKKIQYQNNNGHILDMEAVYKSRQFLNVWTPSEKEIFKEKYLQHPKNFGIIATCLERKSVSDCVQYYYLSKKTENYKQLLRKSRQRTRSSRNNPQKVNSSANTSVVDILTTGVTTRLQREQQAKTVVQPRPQLEAPIESTPLKPNATPPTANNVTTPCTTPTTNATPPNATATPPINATTPTPVKSPDNGDAIVKQAPFCEFDAAYTQSDGELRPKAFFTDDTIKTEANPIVVQQQQTSASNGTTDSPTDAGVAVKKEILDPTTDNISSDQTLSTNTVVENKKKKERRKDKENVAMETTDDEANDIQDKTIQGNCIVCGSQLGPQLQSRPLAPSQASQYGLRDEQVPPNGRVCNTCRCKCVRSRYTHCPLPTCPNARGRVKRLRSFPQRLQDLPADVREPLLAEFHIPSGVTKCCSACFNRIQRRLGPIEEWPDNEIIELRTCLTDLGANWVLIGERLNKQSHLIRSYYAANRKRLNLESCLGDRKPTLTDEEESGSSTSSCEEPINRERHSSDTASAESPPVVQEPPNPNAIKKEEYDSSATETADEGQAPDHYQGSATITPVNTDGIVRQNSSPLTVKDLMLNVIEFSLMKTPGGVQNPPTSLGAAPTISSILNSNDSNEVTIVSEYNLNTQRNQRPDLNLAKLGPLIGATITPVPPSNLQVTSVDRLERSEDLIVMQVGDDRGGGAENLTLDLSIKKPRELPPPPQQQHKHQLHRNAEAYAYERKSPAVYVPRVQNKLPSPKLANPKAGSITLGTPIVNQPRYEGLLRHMAPEPQKMGSITQGTPIHVPHNMQDKRMYEYYNKRPQQQQQQQQQSQQQQVQQQQVQQQQVQQQVAQGGQFAYRQPSFEQLRSREIIMSDYITSQQMHGRGRDKQAPQGYYAGSPHQRTPPPTQQQHQQQQQQQHAVAQHRLVENPQQRQGVIHRHTRPHYPAPPGHEALNSLVDVAVQQPSLPVPSAPHEGLGKTMADNLLEPRRFQMMQQHQAQIRHQQQAQVAQQARLDSQRLEARLESQRIDQARLENARLQQESQQRHDAQQRAYMQQQQQQQQQRAQPQPRGDSSTVTAASLIDAIITHQINQTAEGTREVIANNRSDRLFQGFHRVDAQSQQQPGQSDNGDLAQAIDLDASGGNVAIEAQNSKNLTVKELSDTVIAHDFAARNPAYYHHHQVSHQQDAEWKRRLALKEEAKRGRSPHDERNIIRIAQQENHWNNEQNLRRYQQSQQSHIFTDYVQKRIVEVFTEDNKKEQEMQESKQEQRSDSPGEMVIDEGKDDFNNSQAAAAAAAFNSNYGGYIGKDNANVIEPKPLLSAQYESLSDED